MVIYIEYLIIDNIVMDYLIFYLLSITFKIKYNKIRLIIAMLLGVLCAFFMPFILELGNLLFIYKLLFSVLIIIALIKINSFKKHFMYYIMFWLYTFLLGGIIIGLFNIFNIEYDVSGVLLYSSQIPMGVIILMSLLTIWLLKNVLLAIKKQIRLNKSLYNIKLVDGKREVCATAFLDNGNKITLDGEGVNIISLDLFLKLHKEISLEKMILGKLNSTMLKNLKYINIAGIGLDEKYLTFTIDKMYVESEIFENVSVAVALKNFDDFDCILSDRFVGGIV